MKTSFVPFDFCSDPSRSSIAEAKATVHRKGDPKTKEDEEIQGKDAVED